MLQRNSQADAYPAPIEDFPGRKELTKNARVYGFHATLKAPFRLRRSATLDQVRSICGDIAAQRTSICLEGLDVIFYRGFTALAFPSTLDTDGTNLPQTKERLAHNEVKELASACVTMLEPCRANLTTEEIARRQPALLSVAQRENLNRFGYPHVHGEFNFHMTLSCRLDDVDHSYVEWARSLYQRTVSSTAVLDRLALCEQTQTGEPFRRIDQWVLAEKSV